MRITLAAIALVGLAVQAQAAHCPRGQIWRVHQRICVTKGSHLSHALPRHRSRNERVVERPPAARPHPAAGVPDQTIALPLPAPPAPVSIKTMDYELRTSAMWELAHPILWRLPP